MKKITLLIFGYVISLTSFSQTIPNAGFETWYTSSLPQNWITSDLLGKLIDSSYSGVSVSQTNQSYAGTSAVKMETIIDNGDTISGSIWSVDSIVQLLQGSAGFSYSTRSANLQAYYKFSPTGNDSAYVVVEMTKWNTTTNMRDIVASGGYFIGNSASSYTLLNIPLTYYLNNVNPDSAIIIAGIGAGPASQKHVGTTFYLDALSFTGNVPLGINESENNKYVKLYPNPFNNSATINIDATIKLNSASIVVYDILGKEIKTINNISNNNITLEKGELPTGIYFYKLINNQITVSTGKFMIE